MSEQAEMIPAGIAMVKVLETWGVDHLYGIPGGSFNSTMDALLAEKDNIQYIKSVTKRLAQWRQLRMRS